MDRANLLKEGSTRSSCTDFPIPAAREPLCDPETQAAGMLRETTRSRSQAPMVQPTR